MTPSPLALYRAAILGAIGGAIGQDLAARLAETTGSAILAGSAFGAWLMLPPLVVAGRDSVEGWSRRAALAVLVGASLGVAFGLAAGQTGPAKVGPVAAILLGGSLGMVLAFVIRRREDGSRRPEPEASG